MTATATSPATTTEQAPEQPPAPVGKRRRHRLGPGEIASRAGIQVLLWVYAAYTLAPLLLMVSDSLRTQPDMVKDPLGLPLEPRWENYVEAWVTGSFGVYIWNSIYITVASVLLSTVCSLLAAYAFARARHPFFKWLEAVFMSGLMMPVYLAILPIFFMFDAWRLISNPIGLILVYAALGIPFSTFVLGTFFRQLPEELEEAARIDGARPLRMFWSVMLPLVRPAIATVVVFRFVPVWNDFFFPMILMRDKATYTIPRGVTQFFGEFQSDFPLIFAGLTIATIPLIILFLVATKQIVAGLTAGMGK
ncbi:MAG: carbohydrate ABC transporter permease [Microbacteriaceae bacterium]|nr:carbohydrate ABC transporter permease [Microbacteriaceae bacterium]